MKAFIERSLRPLQCAHAMVGKGQLGSPSGAIFGVADRITRAAFRLAGRLHARARPNAERASRDRYDIESPRVSHVEPVKSPNRRDVVDEASWESFPASDPPGY